MVFVSCVLYVYSVFQFFIYNIIIHICTYMYLYVYTKFIVIIYMSSLTFFFSLSLSPLTSKHATQYAIDDSLPFILNILLAQLYGLLGTLVVTCYGLPWFSLLLVPLGLLYYHIQKYYRRTSRYMYNIAVITPSGDVFREQGALGFPALIAEFLSAQIFRGSHNL